MPTAAPSVRVAGFVLAGLVSLFAVVWALPAGAADQTVEVRDQPLPSYAPRDLEVRSGDTVTWTWVGTARHSVTSDEGTPPGFVFDSDPGCANTPEARGNCRRSTDDDYTDFAWTAPPVTEATTITYHCKLHAGTGMTGSVVVRPPLDPTSNPTTSPSSASPTRTEKKGAESPSDTEETTKQRPDPTEDPRREPAEDTAEQPGVSYGPPDPIAGQPPPTILPSESASPSTSLTESGSVELEDFPEARHPTASDHEEPGAIAIDQPGGPSARAVWLGIASASVLTAAGAFTKLVLFGAPWA